MQGWREEQQQHQGEGSFLVRAPGQSLGAVVNALILNFAEWIPGPFVQLDNFTFADTPPVDEPEEGKDWFWLRGRRVPMPNVVCESIGHERNHLSSECAG